MITEKIDTVFLQKGVLFMSKNNKDKGFFGIDIFLDKVPTKDEYDVFATYDEKSGITKEVKIIFD